MTKETLELLSKSNFQLSELFSTICSHSNMFELSWLDKIYLNTFSHVLRMLSIQEAISNNIEDNNISDDDYNTSKMLLITQILILANIKKQIKEINRKDVYDYYRSEIKPILQEMSRIMKKYDSDIESKLDPMLDDMMQNIKDEGDI